MKDPTLEQWVTRPMDLFQVKECMWVLHGPCWNSSQPASLERYTQPAGIHVESNVTYSGHQEDTVNKPNQTKSQLV